MRCKKCGGTRGTFLAISFACDVCDPPGVSVDAPPAAPRRLADAAAVLAALFEGKIMRRTCVARGHAWLGTVEYLRSVGGLAQYRDAQGVWCDLSYSSLEDWAHFWLAGGWVCEVYEEDQDGH